jgi:hypothetical protein
MESMLADVGHRQGRWRAGGLLFVWDGNAERPATLRHFPLNSITKRVPPLMQSYSPKKLFFEGFLSLYLKHAAQLPNSLKAKR